MNPHQLDSGESAFPAALLILPAVISALIWLGAIVTHLPLH